MEPHNNATTDKVTFSSDDFLSLEGTIQNYTLDIISKQASSIPSEEHGYVKAAMDEWISNIFTNLSYNSDFTDTDQIVRRATLNTVSPTDEELKKAAEKKELEFNASLDKVVKYRAQVPSVLANLSREICESESKEAEQLSVQLPTCETNDKSLGFPVETAEKEYKDAIQLLANLERTVPVEVSKIKRIKDVSALFMD